MADINPRSLIAHLGGENKLITLASSSLAWIEASFRHNHNLGSSAYQNIFGHWSSDYPETTAYLLPSLLKASEFLKDSKYRNLAIDQVEYFDSLLSNAPAIPCSLNNNKIYFFDNSQILLGLCCLHQQHKSEELYSMITKLYSWLIDSVSDDGIVKRANFKEGYVPSYYTRSVWALLRYESTFLSEFSIRSLNLLDRLISLQNENLSFRDWSFDGKPKAFTHTIVYTLRGLWECALIKQDDRIKALVINTVRWINESLLDSENPGFYGSYDQSWEADTSFICSVGSAQFSLLQLMIYDHTGNKEFLYHLNTLFSPIIKSSSTFINNDYAAVPSSIPLWQKYQRFRYTNWTQKFVLDFTVELLQQGSRNTSAQL